MEMARPMETAAPIRVWVEPGYDYGRTAAWMLDLVGCFAWGQDEDVALSRVPSAVGAYAAWLAEHGEIVPVPHTDTTDVLERTPAVFAESDPYRRELNAVFAAERRPATADEVETAVRRLDFAREDLLALLARLDAWEAEHGQLPSDEVDRPESDVPSERTSGEVVRHIGGAEIWLSGRLASDRRYAGAPREGDPRAFLEESHAWAIETVRTLLERDPAISGKDRRGEEWTLPKVLRRLVYHARDHWSELDRRLARAQGAADKLVLRKDVLVDAPALADLFRAVGWYRKANDVPRLARMLEGTTQMVSAWDGERMVGFARAVSDQAYNGYISSVAVHPRWQGKGLGERLITALLEQNDEVKFVLTAVPGIQGFYEGLGFTRDPEGMVRYRSR
jgi:ribosomal protein S18 acetylase RimI-like enzyme